MFTSSSAFLFVLFAIAHFAPAVAAPTYQLRESSNKRATALLPGYDQVVPIIPRDTSRTSIQGRKSAALSNGRSGISINTKRIELPSGIDFTPNWHELEPTEKSNAMIFKRDKGLNLPGFAGGLGAALSDSYRGPGAVFERNAKPADAERFACGNVGGLRCPDTPIAMPGLPIHKLEARAPFDDVEGEVPPSLVSPIFNRPGLPKAALGPAALFGREVIEHQPRVILDPKTGMIGGGFIGEHDNYGFVMGHTDFPSLDTSDTQLDSTIKSNNAVPRALDSTKIRAP